MKAFYNRGKFRSIQEKRFFFWQRNRNKCQLDPLKMNFKVVKISWASSVD